MSSRVVHTGRTFGGRYAIGPRLGEGGWGAVYAATQTDLGRPVAIKVLHTDVALSSDGLARFEREAKAAAALGHPNIVQVTDFQVNPGEPPFLVMEMLSGTTLGALLDTVGRLPAPRVAWIAHQILSALDAAHRAGIVHRDVKPDNVFLVSATGVEDLVKLLDFGIAKLASDGQPQLTSSNAMLGSPAFMAPEQVKGLPLDARVDLYAVGATMYRALAGRLPFDATNIHSLLLAITEQRPAPLNVLDPSIDAALAAVVDRALGKDPSARFASAAEMRAALAPWLGSTPRPSGSVPALSAPPPANPMALTAPAPSAAPTFAPTPGPSMAPPPHGHAPYLGPQTHAVPAARGSGAVVGLLAALVALLALLAVGGAGVLFFLMRGEGASETVTVAASASVAPAPAISAPPAIDEPAPNASAAPSAPAAAVTTASRPRVSPAPTATPSASPVDAGAPAPSAPAPNADAGAPARKQMAGAKPYLSGGMFAPYKIPDGKAAVQPAMPAITACFAATEYDPPDHQFTDYMLTIDPAGKVLSVRRTTQTNPHPKRDACVGAALRATRWPATPTGGTPRVGFTARTRDNP